MAKEKFIDLKSEHAKARKRVEFLRFAKKRLDVAQKICNETHQTLDRLLFLNLICSNNSVDLDELQETQEWLNEYITDQAFKSDV